jgi:hypothetical protein
VGGWLLLLCLILTVWNPGSLALRLASKVATLSTQSMLELLFLAARLIITSIGVAAGLSLLLRRPWAVRLTKVVLVLFCVEGVVRLSSRVGLSEAPPGTRLPLAIALVAHNAVWYAYLQKSRRVRARFDLESQRRLS